MLNVAARSMAMSAAVMPVMLATGIATANLYMQTTQVDAAEKAFTEDLRADAVLVSTTGGLAPGLLDRVRETPGVASASAYASGIGVIDSPRKGYQDSSGYPLQGVSAQGPDGTAPVRLTSGSLTGLTGRTVALPEQRAAKLGVGRRRRDHHDARRRPPGEAAGGGDLRHPGGLREAGAAGRPGGGAHRGRGAGADPGPGRHRNSAGEAGRGTGQADPVSPSPTGTS